MLSIEAISDRLEIEDVIAAYPDAIDRRDYGALRQIFTPDAHIDYSAFGGIVGSLDDIIAFLGPAMAPFKTFQHLCGKTRVFLEGDRARASTQCLNPIITPVDPDKPTMMWCALWYHDELVRTPAGWRIAVRREEAVMFEGIPAGFAEWLAGQKAGQPT